ncbi:MAG: heterodisulfide reductase subunit A, partial [Chloroflexi bacterium]|nr:heterodisulfide reductase subunit A [Chloroflexota bacterium]
MDKKTGVYICTGCGIGDALDADKLCELANDEYSVDVCKTHPALCGEEGAQVILKDIEDGVNTVVIAACSPRAKTDVFSYDTSATVLERINLREHVIWTHPANDEDTQMLAEDYLRMGLAKAAKVTLPNPFLEAVEKGLLVVGGGISGMTSA